ncbi:hypothetical protein QWY28_20110 [Nocardioides sp. SOB77]|uniref:DUF4333 domain-containing protein n=1 Tax=Nocardioides oceani TaxID=3058369 RepID=A0ABT8FL89_9ACTN|nr:hypothetical protein [Nocardioides oceani]MDN4175280.1 hypothetical protein [Nocardioides oceani]
MTAPEASPSPAAAPSGRGRAVVALVGLALVAAAATAGWWSWAGSATDDLSVTVARPRCEGAAVRARDDAIEARPGMRCRVTATIANGGGGSVRVDHVDWPYLGSGAQPVVRAAAADGLADEPRDALHARLVVDRELAGGEALRVHVDVVFRRQGCMSAGTFSADGFPTVALSRLGRDLEVRADHRLLVARRADWDGCGR